MIGSNTAGSIGSTIGWEESILDGNVVDGRREMSAEVKAECRGGETLGVVKAE